jgi:very-short-patch-repair endonuclease
MVQDLLAGTARGKDLTTLAEQTGAHEMPAARRALSIALLEHLRAGHVRRAKDGRWHWIHAGTAEQVAVDPVAAVVSPVVLARGFTENIDALADPGADPVAPTMSQLLAYYHAALRSDVRGKARLFEDRAGKSWHQFLAKGRWWPDQERVGRLVMPLANLAPEFRAALERRADDDTLAVGWAMAKGRDGGLDVLWPVGLLAARWWRDAGNLCIAMERPDTVPNPAWVRAQAGAIGWTAAALADRLGGSVGEEQGRGLDLDAFADVLREAAAPQVRGSLRPEALEAHIGPEETGIWGAGVLILPEEVPMTRPAVRDIGSIMNWPDQDRQHSGLGPLLARAQTAAKANLCPVLEPGPLNPEQLRATRAGLKERLTVVTGPPGTGKSQTVAALVSSTVLAGKSVLVAARNHQALDAIADRIGGRNVVRTRDRNGEIDVSFKDIARELLSAPTASPDAGVLEQAIRLTSDLDRQRAEALDSLDARRRIEFRLADLLEAPPPEAPKPSIWAAFLAWLGRRQRPASARPDVDELRREALTIEPGADPVELSKGIREAVAQLLPRAFDAARAIPDEVRADLGETLQDLDLEGGTRLPDLVIDLVLAARPVWLTTTLSAPARIPLRPALFDLVIIDEASQADIPSAIPVMARGARVVVVGDDRQLSFIPGLGRAQERNLMRAAGITTTTTMGKFAQGTSSLFDLARVQAARGDHAHAEMLRRQYRSAPEITEFIGDEFYDGKLLPAVSEEDLKVPPGVKAGLAWTDIPGRTSRSTEGGYTNAAETAAIKDHLHKLLVEEGYDGSVGVVTPFNAQAGALKRALTQSLPDGVRAAVRLKVDTIDSFQGDERALILFSPVVAGRDGDQAARFLARDRRRLNVAISRAQAVAHVFGDLAFARTGRVPVLGRLAAAATEPRRRAGDAEAGSLWERRLADALHRAGLEPVPQYPVLGRRLDFALFRGEVKLDVEVDGRRWHTDADGNRKADDVFRDAQLRAAGWRVARFWVSELEQDIGGCVERIKRELG